MQILLQEVKKMFIYQKGLIFICLFLVFSTASLFLFDTPTNTNMQLYAVEYQHYLKNIQGKLTPKSEMFLEAEAENLSEAQIALDHIYEDFYDGIMSKAEFITKITPFDIILQNKKGFDLIYEQYTYVRENSDNRYFLNTNGWNGLLSGEHLDLLLLLCLLLLITPVFCNEVSTKMDDIIITQKKGARYTAICKVLLVIGVSVLLCIYTFFIKYLFYSAVYGLSNGNFPLQSLEYFASSTKSITLIQTFIGISICKTLGFLLFCMLIMVVSVTVKKYPLTLFICSTLILLPHFGLQENGAKYFALPLGLMLGTGFFKGNESTIESYTGQEIMQFTQISTPTFWMIIIILMALVIILWLVINHKYMNVWRLKRYKCVVKYLHLFLICTLISNLLGCTQSNFNDYDIYNMNDRFSFENEKFHFYVQYKDSKVDIAFEDKGRKKTRSLNLNPMKAMMNFGNVLYGNGEFIYYIKYNIDKSGQKQELDRFSIIELDTSNFNEKIIFEKNISENEDSLFGISSINVTTNKSLNDRFFTVSAFFLDKHNIYLICDDEIMQINRLTKKTKFIPITGKGNIAYDGRHLYYINDKYQIIKYDTKNAYTLVFENAIMEQFYLTNTEILYRNRQDDDKIYGMSLDGKKTYKLSDKSVLSIRGDETYLYFTDMEDLKDYRMDRDSGDISLIEKP